MKEDPTIALGEAASTVRSTNVLMAGGFFGTLFHDNEVANTLSSDAMLAQSINFEKAWTCALQRCRLVDDDVAEEALASISSCHVDRDRLARASERDGLPIPDLVAQLRANTPERSRIAVHTGATSQDVGWAGASRGRAHIGSGSS